MSEKPQVLIVDDDARVRTMLRRYLAEEGFEVSEAADGVEMRKRFGPRIDLVLLDLMMPGEDGLSLARTIRQTSEVPIIVLTGKGDVIDRVAGLEAGADDYLGKPFHLRELLARIRTVMRRTRPGRPAETPAQPPRRGEPDALLFQGWRLELGSRELHRPGGAVQPLTGGEFELLRALARNPNRVVSRDQLMDLVKGQAWAANDRAIDTQIARLRRKIEAEPGRPSLLKTVRGAGYVFAANVTPG